MQIPAEKFQAAVKTINVVSMDPVLPSSQFVRLVAKKGMLRMTLSGLLFGDSALTAEDPNNQEDWVFYTDRRPLTAFASAANGSVTAQLEKTVLTLSSAGQNLRLTAPKDSPAGYGIWPTMNKVDLNLDGPEVAMLHQYCSSGVGGDQYAAIQLIENFGAIATDSIVLSIVERDAVPKATIPISVVPHLARSDAPAAWIGKHGVGVTAPGGRVYQTLSSSLKAYPVDKLVAIAKTGVGAGKPAIFSVTAADLAALSTLGQYPYEGIGVIGHVALTEKDLQVRVEFTGGTAQRSIAVKKADPKAAPKDWRWSLSKILPWLKFVASREDQTTVFCRRIDAATVFDCKPDGTKSRYGLIVSDV